MRGNRTKIFSEVDPDEIFIDSKNLPSFDTDRFEGRIERALSKRSLVFFSIITATALIGYLSWIAYLQIFRGESYATRSADNSLEQVVIYAERGTISDRNGDLLAWNNPNTGRDYKRIDGIANVIGHLGFPTEDEVKSGEARDLSHLIGKDGIEQYYNQSLEGIPGVKLEEHDAHGNITSESVQVFPQKGTSIELSIDSAVQEKMYQTIKSFAKDRGFSGGAGGIMDIKTGELLALVTYPEYTLQNFASTTDSSLVEKELKDPNTPFLNRAISGLYTPGSIVKPYMAIAALAENVITPEKGIVSKGSISIQNPYDKEKKTVFKDWKAHGWVDMRRALAVSSDVYFYEVGGGYEDQPGIGIAAINKYFRMFGFAEKTGIDLFGEATGQIPSPEWKAKNFDGEEWYLGNTYHTSIGQYGFQVTPLQAIRSVAAIASDGFLVKPHLAKVADSYENISSRTKIDLPASYFKVAKEGMRLSVTEGVASALNIPGYKIAAKTGTAELGITKQTVNSWITGYFPYEEPRYAFAIVMEKGPLNNMVGATAVMRQFMDWLIVAKPEYTNPESKTDI